MGDLIILGTDTDAGKTAFAAVWMTLFGQDYAYWKPVETGPSDTETLRRLVPTATVLPPSQRFELPVAPPLAARHAGQEVCAAARLAAARPQGTDQYLLIETFGSPFSPLNETELQIELIRRLEAAAVLVVSSALGAIGRAIQALEALQGYGVSPVAVVLVGPTDPFAEETLRRHRPEVVVTGMPLPVDWTPGGLAAVAEQARTALGPIRHHLTKSTPQLDLLDRDRRVVWHPYTALRGDTDPLVVIGAEQEFLHLADGTRVIDAISSWWTILHGHRHPVLMRALREATAQIDHVLFAGVTHPRAVELAELLLRSVSPSMANGGRVFYSDNGSTAVEVALKMAYQFWLHQGRQRPRFVGFEHGYHGDTFGAMAVSRDPVFFGSFEPLLFQADIVPLDPDALDIHLRRRAAETAAVIIEPLVQGAGGMRMHTPETLRDLAQVAQQHDVLLIADEVMTGGGRTGTLWAHRQADITQDLICAAKTLAGGVLPLAATLVAPHIAAAFDTADRSKTFFHGHSFTAHPLACAIAVANWTMLAEQPLTRPGIIEAFWQRTLGQLGEHPRVRDVRLRGSIAAVELDVAGGYLADISRRLRAFCLERGVFLRPLGGVLYALPPLDTAEESLQRIAETMIAALEVA